MSDIPAATLQAYLDARVWIDLPTGGIVVSPGPLQGSAGEFPFDPAAIVHVISPEPPRAATIELPPGAAGLSAYLHELGLALEVFDAVGADAAADYHEWSVATLGLTDDEALAVARAYRQDAIFRWTRDAWALVECESERVHSMGWRVVLAEGWQEIVERGL